MRKNNGQLVLGSIRVAVGLPCPIGEVVAGVQGIRVFRAEDPLAHGQQHGVLIPALGASLPPGWQRDVNAVSADFTQDPSYRR
jgi:hypothetical protein